MMLPNLVIAPSAKGGKNGRGVFTTQSIAANTTIEISPVIILQQKDKPFIEQTHLHHYVFEWGKTKKQLAVGLGYISMYNHSYTANCVYEMDYEAATIKITTLVAINKGEELYINYNAIPNDTTPIWFNAI
jgi:uncharacterized protein